MSTPDDDRVALYLAKLQDELRNVAPRVRDQVVRDVATRIAAERDSGVDVRTVLADAGDPLDIAADVRERHGVRERSNWRETAAVLLLPFGGVVIPIAGWFVGVYLLWSSPAWSVREKLVGTLVVPFGTLGPLLLVSRSPWYALLLALPLSSAGYLALRLVSDSAEGGV
jgi:HAAS domain-containing protein